MTRWLNRLHDGDAQHRAAGVERQPEAILVDQMKPQRLRVERFSALGIRRRHEDDGP